MKLEESFAFYKSIYERELKRRFDLDGLNTQMLTVASFALALIYFLFKQIKINSNIWYDNILIMLSIIGFISWLISIYFIAKASNNLLNGFSYIELPNANGLRNHELKFTDDHSKNKELLKFNTFTEYLISKFINCTDSHIEINDLRSNYLYKSRKYLIMTIMVEVFLAIFYLHFYNFSS